MKAVVHSLDGQLARADWHPVDAGELAALAPHYPETLRGAQVLWNSPRPFAASALVRSDAGDFFVKRHDPRVRDDADLLEEHAWTGHLRERGIPAPRVLRDLRGRGAVPIGGQVFELQERMAGEDLYRETHSWQPVRDAAGARAIGRMCARLHIAAAGYEAPVRAARPLRGGCDIARSTTFAAGLGAFALERPAVDDYLRSRALVPALERCLAPWHAALVPHASEMAPLWVHNDLHASNLAWSADGGEVRAVFDFGLANRGCALSDLATAIERNCIAWLDLGSSATIGRPDLARALLDGYCELLPLSPARRAALCALLPFCHVEFALSEVDYFAGVLGDPARSALAAGEFLLGHADWFASGPGRDFLAELARPAARAAGR